MKIEIDTARKFSESGTPRDRETVETGLVTNPEMISAFNEHKVGCTKQRPLEVKRETIESDSVGFSFILISCTDCKGVVSSSQRIS